MSAEKPTWNDLLHSVADELVHLGADPFDVAAVLLSPIDSETYIGAQVRLREQMAGQTLPEPLHQLMTEIVTVLSPQMKGNPE